MGNGLRACAISVPAVSGKPPRNSDSTRSPAPLSLSLRRTSTWMATRTSACRPGPGSARAAERRRQRESAGQSAPGGQPLQRQRHRDRVEVPPAACASADAPSRCRSKSALASTPNSSRLTPLAQPEPQQRGREGGARATLPLLEISIPEGSCPYLYAWDGPPIPIRDRSARSVPPRLRVSESRFVEADPDEYVWIGEETAFPPRDGHYVLQLTENCARCSISTPPNWSSWTTRPGRRCTPLARWCRAGRSRPRAHHAAPAASAPATLSAATVSTSPRR